MIRKGSIAGSLAAICMLVLLVPPAAGQGVRQLERTHYHAAASGGWVFDHVEHHTFDGKGRMAANIRLVQRYGRLDTLTAFQCLWDTDARGNARRMTLKREYDPKTYTVVPLELDTAVYRSDSSLLMYVRYKYNNTSGQYELLGGYRREDITDAHGRILRTEGIQYLPDNGSLKAVKETDSLFYDAKGRLSASRRYRYNGEAWAPLQWVEYTWNEKDEWASVLVTDFNAKGEINYITREDSLQWIDFATKQKRTSRMEEYSKKRGWEWRHRTHTTPGNNGSYVRTIDYWDQSSNEWIQTTRLTLIKDPQGNVTENCTEHKDKDGKWVFHGPSKTSWAYTYDAEGRIAEVIEKVQRALDEHPRVTGKYEYTY